MGEVRGNWEPIVTTEEFERGKEILLKNGNQKMNFKRKHYLLRGIVSVQVGEKQYKLYGSTPTGKSQSYAYYVTHTKIDGKPLRFSVDVVDQQIPTILADIGIDPELIPSIQATYQSEIKKNTQDGKADKLEHLQQRLKNLQDEEARLARLFMTGKINEETYDRLRGEWKEKTRQIQMTVKELEFDASKYLDDLDVAITLLTKISVLFDRLKEKERTAILQVLIKQVIVNIAGEIIQIELHSPFSYLFTLVSQYKEGKSSSCISLGTPTNTRTSLPPPTNTQIPTPTRTRTPTPIPGLPFNILVPSNGTTYNCDPGSLCIQTVTVQWVPEGQTGNLHLSIWVKPFPGDPNYRYYVQASPYYIGNSQWTSTEVYIGQMGDPTGTPFRIHALVTSEQYFRDQSFDNLAAYVLSAHVDVTR